MFSKFSEEFVELWMDINSYERIPYESSSKLERAQMIFRKYFAENCLLGSFKHVHMDSATLELLRRDLMIDAQGTVCQRDSMKLCEAFRFIFGKIVTILKFDFMPQFLVSDDFQTLESKLTRLLQDPEKAFQNASDSIDYIAMDQILKSPLIQSSFLDFIRAENRKKFKLMPKKPTGWRKLVTRKSSGSFRSCKSDESSETEDPIQPEAMDTMVSMTLASAEELVELYQEIEDFRISKSLKHQFERMKRIFARYGVTDNDGICPSIEFLSSHFHHFEMKVGRYRNIVYKDANFEFFKPVQDEIQARLERYLLPLYMESSSLAQLKCSMNQVTAPFKRERVHEKVQELSKFAKDRRLFENFAYTYTLESALALPWGVFYIKRFARKRLQEESLLFVLDCQEYQRICKSEIKDEVAFAGQRIMDLYISTQGPLQINISGDMREEIMNQIEFTSSTFIESYKEVLRILELNTWPQFQQDNAHENFKKKCTHHNKHPNPILNSVVDVENIHLQDNAS